MQNVIITPHIASHTESSFLKVFTTAVDNLKAGIKGKGLPYPVQYANHQLAV